ncbi:MAG: metal-dependent transcriptional regulator [Thermoplasmata archaeon]|nr:metal-dependent transcriptional regulator [Thermoplasmata archaeon]
MEPLQRLTRKQLDTLQRVERIETSAKGAALNALARSLHVSAPTALAHLTVLESLGLVARSRGKTRVSARGQTCLREYVRHHRVAETLFAEAGLSPDDACVAAHEVDMGLSHRIVEKVCESERHPAKCPHGQPIDPCGSPRQSPRGPG